MAFSIAQSFNRLFENFAQSGGHPAAQLRHAVARLPRVSRRETPGFHDELVHIARAAGTSRPDYAVISEAFAHIAKISARNAGQAEGHQRELMQEDAAILLTYAHLTAPRHRNGSISPTHAAAIFEATARLVETAPGELIQSTVYMASGLARARLEHKGAPQPAVSGNPQIDTMAVAAQQALRRHLH